MNIIRMQPSQLGALAAFVARLQADPAHRVGYFGEEVEESARRGTGRQIITVTLWPASVPPRGAGGIDGEWN